MMSYYSEKSSEKLYVNSLKLTTIASALKLVGETLGSENAGG